MELIMRIEINVVEKQIAIYSNDVLVTKKEINIQITNKEIREKLETEIIKTISNL